MPGKSPHDAADGCVGDHSIAPPKLGKEPAKPAGFAARWAWRLSPDAFFAPRLTGAGGRAAAEPRRGREALPARFDSGPKGQGAGVAKNAARLEAGRRARFYPGGGSKPGDAGTDE